MSALAALFCAIGIVWCIFCLLMIYLLSQEREGQEGDGWWVIILTVNSILGLWVALLAAFHK
jgi:hypothetical protein